MKRLFCLTALLLLLFPSARAETWRSLSQLHAETPDRWVQTYETEWRTVSIDAELRLPRATALPVVLAQGAAEEPTLTPQEAGWDSMQLHSAYRLILSSHVPDYPSRVNGLRVGQAIPQDAWYGGFSPENRYIPMDDTTFGGITARVRERLARLGYDPDCLDLETPSRLWNFRICAQGTKKDLLPGYLCMEVRPLVAGVPVLCHAWEAVHTSGDQRSDEWSLSPDSAIGYSGFLGDLSHLYLTPMAVCETLAEDVPLCPLSQVLAYVEEEIRAGRIRKVYEIELGYALYNEPDVYRAKAQGGTALERKLNAMAQESSVRYYLKPVWQVNCLWTDSPSAKLRNTSGYTDDERNSLDYRQLFIDAQTGAFIAESTAKDRCAFKGFITWEDVR